MSEQEIPDVHKQENLTLETVGKILQTLKCETHEGCKLYVNASGLTLIVERLKDTQFEPSRTFAEMRGGLIGKVHGTALHSDAYFEPADRTYSNIAQPRAWLIDTLKNDV